MPAGTQVFKMELSLKRTTEFLAVCFFFANMFAPLLYVFVFIFILFFTPFWWISLLYGGWIYQRSGEAGIPKTKPWEALRNHRYWNEFGDYFPTHLIKTAELPPENNYLFAWHPHGILGISANVTACGRGQEFIKLFPEITRHAATLDVHFLLPFRRTFLQSLGYIPVSFNSLVFKLSKPTGGNAVTVAVGGAEEALESRPSSYKLCLNRRKGFIRVCLTTGAHLVPVYAFGETSTYDQVANPEGSLLRSFQQTVKKYTGVSPPFVLGANVVPIIPGPLPKRAEMNIVFGAPIPVEKTENPTTEQIDELHSLYKEKLVELFETHKRAYGVPEDAHLEFY